MSNTYTNAADAYGKSQTEGNDQRALEGRILLKAAKKLQDIHDNWDEHTAEQLEEAIVYNRKLWTVFAGEMTNDDNPLPLEIKNNIANISIFIFKRCVEIQAEPAADKLEALIEINRNIAAGLLSQPKAAAPEKAEEKPAKETSAAPQHPPIPEKTEKPAEPVGSGITIDS